MSSTFIDRLAQICIEDSYNRDQIREFIEKDIQESEEDLKPLITQATTAISKYLIETYSYTSKNKRLRDLVLRNKFKVSELIHEIIVATIIESKPVKIQKIIGKLIPYFNYEDVWDSIKTAAECLIVVGKTTDLYTVILASNSESGSIEIQSNFVLDEKVIDKINKLKYLPPMVCDPELITHNYKSAYLTKKDSVILGPHNHHNYPQALDVLNIANSVKLSLDENILAIPEPIKFKKPAKSKFTDNERKQALLELVNSSKDVYQEILNNNNQFNFSWKFDKRGRMYSLGYHVNIQSTEYKKALINLNKKEVIKLT